jgi:hypothetical protein
VVPGLDLGEQVEVVPEQVHVHGRLVQRHGIGHERGPPEDLTLLDRPWKVLRPHRRQVPVAPLVPGRLVDPAAVPGPQSVREFVHPASQSVREQVDGLIRLVRGDVGTYWRAVNVDHRLGQRPPLTGGIGDQVEDDVDVCTGARVCAATWPIFSTG